MRKVGKGIISMLLAAGLTLGAAMPALAGQWIQDNSRPECEEGVSNWRYRRDDGSYVAGQWEWIDRGDGFGECYGFNPEGWMYASVSIPKVMMPMEGEDYTYTDSYTVNESGRLCKSGFVVFRSLTEPVNRHSHLSDEEAYARILALQPVYPEGTPWTNDNLYFRRSRILGGGCAAFAYIVQDAVFGVDVEHIQEDVLDWEKIRVGDQIRYTTKGIDHTVIVLGKTEDHLTVAEGNFSRKIHWGREVPRSDIESAFIYRETCY